MNRLIKYFNYIVLSFFIVIILLALYGDITNKANSIRYSWIIIPLGAAIAFSTALGLERLKNHLKNMTVYEYRRLTAAFCGILFVSQIIISVTSDLTPKNDLSYICMGAKNLILGRDIYSGFPEYHMDYFACYPNNHMLLMAVYAAYKLEYILTGSMTDFLPTAVNILALSISYWLLCRCGEMIYSPAKALICAVRGMLFTPFITYAAFFYTDSMAMPLITAAAYFYLNYRKSQKLSKLIFCGIFLGMAFKMKGSSFILFIAVITDMLIKKQKFKDIVALAIPYTAVCKIISAIAMKLLGLTRDILKEKSFPFIHWIMMSADGRGGYNSEDFLYTQRFWGCNKISADIARLGDKLTRQGFWGFLIHLGNKIAYTWENITFMAGYYYDGGFNTPSYYIAAFFCHFIILFSILISLFKTRKKGCDEALLFRLSLFGLCFFLLIWETRCRYLVSFFPLFLLI